MPAVGLPALRHQFVAAIDMLENAIRACPEELWADDSRPPQFSYIAFHTLFWLDYFLADSERGFAPPAPFTLDEMDPAGLYPERPYTPAELLAYLAHGRARAHTVLGALTEARAGEPCGFAARSMSVFEHHLVSMRHVQHHAAQLNLLLRHRTDSAPTWVGRGRDS